MNRDMKNYKISILLSFLVFVALGCHDDEADLVIPHLEVGEKILSFNDSDVQTLTIEANGRWSVRAIQDTSEFMVSPAQGVGNGEITITLNRTKPENIRGYLKITYLDGTDEGMEVAQGVRLLADKYDMEVVPKKVTLNAALDYTKQIFRVNVHDKWTAELSDTTWCTLDRTSGDGEGYITLSLKEGVNMKEKSMEIYISPKSYPRMKYVLKVNEDHEYLPEKCIILNKASIGKGIDVVVIGDGFFEEDLEKGGRWEEACRLFVENFFSMEPYKSFREYFNLYAIPAPAEKNLRGEITALVFTKFMTYFPGGGGVSTSPANRVNITEYAYKNSPVEKEKGTWDELTTVVIPNADDAGFYYLSNNYTWPSPDNCMVIACLSILAEQPENMDILFGRKFLGGTGGFVYLANNSYNRDETWAGDITSYQENQREKGINQGIEVDPDPEKFVNRAWAELLEMNYRNVYKIEGGLGYQRGVWRSSYENMMSGLDANREQYYSPVQRELIVRKIYKLAGLEEQYTLQTFLDYDVINEELDNRMMELYNPDGEKPSQKQ